MLNTGHNSDFYCWRDYGPMIPYCFVSSLMIFIQSLLYFTQLYKLSSAEGLFSLLHIPLLKLNVSCFLDSNHVKYVDVDISILQMRKRAFEIVLKWSSKVKT